MQSGGIDPFANSIINRGELILWKPYNTKTDNRAVIYLTP